MPLQGGVLQDSPLFSGVAAGPGGSPLPLGLGFVTEPFLLAMRAERDRGGRSGKGASVEMFSGQLWEAVPVWAGTEWVLCVSDPAWGWCPAS